MLPHIIKLWCLCLCLLSANLIQCKLQPVPAKVVDVAKTVSLPEYVSIDAVVKLVSNHQLELHNPHRTNAVLRVTLNGIDNESKKNVKIEKWQTSKAKDSMRWLVSLADHSTLDLLQYGGEKENNFTQINLMWNTTGVNYAHEFCLHYGTGAQNKTFWYSTTEERVQEWPMSSGKVTFSPASFTTGDFFQGKQFGSIVESMYFNTDGFAVSLNQTSPWFIRRDANNGDPLLCGRIDPNSAPYGDAKSNVKQIPMTISVIMSENIRSLHKEVMKNKSLKPTDIPDERMFHYPIWSTWAEYSKDINQSKVLDFAQQISNHKFPNAQLEIDDKWEKHYGDFQFDNAKFPNPKELVTKLHQMGFRVTLWVYPFVNHDSEAYKDSMPYLVKSPQGNTVANVQWWNGQAGHVDFTNDEALKWYVKRLEKIRNETGIDSFKFDAGEVNWYGTDVEKRALSNRYIQMVPNLATQAYVKTAAKLGKMIEVRSAFETQNFPIFVRMLDKNSQWGVDNGLKSLITTALTMAIGGYSYCLPDMIGGNAYGGRPSEELYIRWLQANIFMPSMQFSIPPWRYSNTTVDHSRRYVQLHAENAPTLIALAKRVQFGEPILRPMWYAEPDDARTYTIADQYMVGDDIVVAPVVEEKQRERSVYLPTGTWIDQHGKRYQGPNVHKVAAPLEELPYFKRVQ